VSKEHEEKNGHEKREHAPSGVKNVSGGGHEENTGHQNIEHEPIGEKKESCVLKENIMHEKNGMH